MQISKSGPVRENWEKFQIIYSDVFNFQGRVKFIYYMPTNLHKLWIFLRTLNNTTNILQAEDIGRVKPTTAMLGHMGVLGLGCRKIGYYKRTVFGLTVTYIFEETGFRLRIFYKPVKPVLTKVEKKLNMKLGKFLRYCYNM